MGSTCIVGGRRSARFVALAGWAVAAVGAIGVLGALAACGPAPVAAPPGRVSPRPAMTDWPRGLLPLDRVKVADFAPAIAWAMADKRAEIARIAAQREPPDFANTIAALERVGQPLADLRGLLDLWDRAFHDDALTSVQADVQPKLLAFDSEVLQNAALARRVEAVYRARGTLDAEARAVTEHHYRAFRLAGTQLPDAARARLVAIGTRMGELYVLFNQNVNAGAAEVRVVLRDEAELAGLPAAFRAEAADAARAAGLPGGWLIRTNYNSLQTFLSYATRRDVRERVLYAARHRANRGGAHDNDAVVKELLALRRERAMLLGYSSYAEMRLEGSMMHSSANALAWLAALAEPASRQARLDVEELQRAADHSQDVLRQPRFVLEPWDLRFYEQRIREQRFQVDDAEVASYLDVESTREAMLWVAGQLFGLTFTLVADAPSATTDIRAWTVSRGGAAIGYLYIDAHPRAGKQSGAWTMPYRDSQRLTPGRLPVVMASYNLPRSPPGTRAPISWPDAVGMFHEFGHALQALLSDVTYPSIAGLNVPGDTRELASQWLERYVATPEVLRRFTRSDTGAAMPAALAAKIEAARVFCEGIRTTEMLETAVYDLRMHLAATGPDDLPGLEREVRAAVHAPPQVLPISVAAQAVYLFGDDNYSAQFYSYLWSDELASAVYTAFLQAGGPYDRRVAERLRATLLSRGSAVDPAAAIVTFLGKPPGIDALLVRRSLGTSPATTR
jgi:peptidyl-dipeptidase Dcp